MKLNIGSNNKLVDGYKNVDALRLPNVDIVHDLTDFPWPFQSEDIDEIITQECLEHISWRKTGNFLAECYRILKYGGKLKIQVPDIGQMCRLIDRQCACVPNKADRAEDFKADPACPICKGEALINPIRWFTAFVGAQKHQYDAHLTIFTKELIESYLKAAGFKNINFVPHIYKIIVEADK